MNNLIALCPNCHERADRGIIDRAALRRLKVALATSQIHLVVSVIVDPSKPFHPSWGPETLTVDERQKLILELQQRGMLGGILVDYEWPLVRCMMCERLALIDRCWTPQDDDAIHYAAPLATYCDHKCAREYQRAMGDFLGRVEYPDMYYGEYILQNTVEMTVAGTKVFRRRCEDPQSTGDPVTIDGAEKPDIVTGRRIF